MMLYEMTPYFCSLHTLLREDAADRMYCGNYAEASNVLYTGYMLADEENQ